MTHEARHGPSLPTQVSNSVTLAGIEMNQPAWVHLVLRPRFDGAWLLADTRRATARRGLARLLDANHKKAVAGATGVLLVTGAVLAEGAWVPLLGMVVMAALWASLLLPATRWDGVTMELHQDHVEVVTPYSRRKTRRLGRRGLKARVVPGVGEGRHVEVEGAEGGAHTVAWQLSVGEAEALASVLNAYAAQG